MRITLWSERDQIYHKAQRALLDLITSRPKLPPYNIPNDFDGLLPRKTHNIRQIDGRRADGCYIGNSIKVTFDFFKKKKFGNGMSALLRSSLLPRTCFLFNSDS